MRNQQINEEGLSQLCSDMVSFVSNMEECLQTAKKTLSKLSDANLGGDKELPRVAENFEGCLVRSNNFCETVQEKVPKFKELLENARARVSIQNTPAHGPNSGSDIRQKPRGYSRF